MNDAQITKLILPEGSTLRDAMLSFDVSALQVVLVCDSQRRLIGLASEGDVRRALLGGHGLAASMEPFLNRKPVTGRADMAREELVALLSEKVNRLPVLDENGVVVDFLFSDQRTMIPIATPIVGERELRYVTDAVLSGWISSQGKYIGEFEERFAAFCGTQHAVAVSNGTSALHLALIALGVGPGDEVIVPALTFVATASAVRHCHATPIFVDVSASDWNIDPDKIAAAITPRTKVIIPVHLFGKPCRMGRIMDIAQRHKLWVVEDAAQAHGATWQGQRVGTIGHMGCFSFYGNKIITTGEGGMIVTKDTDLDRELRILRDHGMSLGRRYWHEVVGYNYRMTNMQAAIGVAQLERWEQTIASKDSIHSLYQGGLDRSCFELPVEASGIRSVCWLYTLLLRSPATAKDRDLLLDRLKAQGVDGRPMFYLVPEMPPYFEANWRRLYPVAASISERGLSLPSSVELAHDAIMRVIAIMNAHKDNVLNSCS